jgi:hypothetical protein
MMRADERTISTREQALYAAMLAIDYPVLDALLSDQVQYIHSTGVVESKAEYFAGLRRGLYEYGNITYLSGATRLFKDVAITTGVIDMLVGAEGSAKGTIRLQHVLVWVNEGGAWRLRLRQATRIPT